MRAIAPLGRSSDPRPRGSRHSVPNPISNLVLGRRAHALRLMLDCIVICAMTYGGQVLHAQDSDLVFGFSPNTDVDLSSSIDELNAVASFLVNGEFTRREKQLVYLRNLYNFAAALAEYCSGDSASEYDDLCAASQTSVFFQSAEHINLAREDVWLGNYEDARVQYLEARELFNSLRHMSIYEFYSSVGFVFDYVDITINYESLESSSYDVSSFDWIITNIFNYEVGVVQILDASPGSAEKLIVGWTVPFLREIQQKLNCPDSRLPFLALLKVMKRSIGGAAQYIGQVAELDCTYLRQVFVLDERDISFVRALIYAFDDTLAETAGCSQDDPNEGHSSVPADGVPACAFVKLVADERQTEDATFAFAGVLAAAATMACEAGQSMAACTLIEPFRRLELEVVQFDD